MRSSWLPVLALSAALAATSWAAVQTGEREEDAVEEVVPASAIHDHEEKAELFFPLTLAGLLIVSGGLLRGRPGSIARGTAVVFALGLTYAGYRVGHSGGELVYEHGAASAYTTAVDDGRGADDSEARTLDDDHRE